MRSKVTAPAVKDNSNNSIVLDALDDKGRARKVMLRALPIGPTKICKQDEFGTSEASNADEHEAFSNLSLTGERIIEPQYPLNKLIMLKDQSTELRQCIKAMVTNTVGFGYQLRARPIPDVIRKELEGEIAKEKARLTAMLETVHPTESFDSIRKKVKDDQHSCGNGYLELIENPTGDLVGLSHVRGHLVRLTEQQKAPVRVLVPRVVPDDNYAISFVPMYHRFRKFAMIGSSGKPLWFKEAGDPRLLDKYTGKYADLVPPQRRATALLHFKIYHACTPYGVPEYIGNLFSLYGSRAAENINYNTLTSNGIPSMFVIVENGALTEGSIQRLKEWTEAQVQNSLNYSTFLLLEGDTAEEGIPSPNNFKIRIQPLANYQKTDELFQNYDSNNKDKVRQAFRLAPIFVGRTDDYNRATADSSRAVTDEQVFAPERSEDDFLYNRHVLLRWGARYHTFKSNHPNVTDDTELVRLMGIAERSGGMTPRRADRIVRDVFGDDIGPLPEGVPLDVPFSITFAEAQQGMTGGGAEPQQASAKRVIDGLLDLRRRVEKELDDRLYLNEEGN